jgi:hypothetical protein
MKSESLGGSQMRIWVLAAFVLTLPWMSASAQCPGGTTTTITGTVYAPNGVDPLPNVLVYVPSGSVASFSSGVQCLPAGPPVSALVQTVSNVAGQFTLTNVPSGAVTLVIQAGKWRRQVPVNVTACTSNALTAAQTRLPQNSSEGDIPKIAIVTGSVDNPECVLAKIGISLAEFTDPQGPGRINLYTGAGAAGGAGAQISNNTPRESLLWSNQATLNQYDAVMLASQGSPKNNAAATTQIPAAHGNFANYVNAGGRIFASHYAYTWLYNTAPFSSTASWAVNTTALPSPQTAVVNQSSSAGQQLAQWLQVVGASTNGQISIAGPHSDLNGVVAPTQSWLSIGQSPVQLTFNTPVGSAPANQCGRVLFNDYHVYPSPGTTWTSYVFPSECTGGPLTSQEKLLEYELFELTGQ